MDTTTKHTPGPCIWNGNEIVEAEIPHRVVAGLAPGAPDKWGHLFAAAPELLDFAVTVRDDLRSMAEHWDLSSTEARWLEGAERFVAKATGEEATR